MTFDTGYRDFIDRKDQSAQPFKGFTGFRDNATAGFMEMWDEQSSFSSYINRVDDEARNEQVHAYIASGDIPIDVSNSWRNMDSSGYGNKFRVNYDEGAKWINENLTPEDALETDEELLVARQEEMDVKKRWRDDILSRASGQGEIGAFAGSAAGAFFDPVVMVSGMVLTPAYGAVSASRALYALKVGGRAALGGVGSQAVIEPMIHSWQEELGREYTYKNSLFNLAAAGVFSGVLSGGIASFSHGYLLGSRVAKIEKIKLVEDRANIAKIRDNMEVTLGERIDATEKLLNDPRRISGTESEIQNTHKLEQKLEMLKAERSSARDLLNEGPEQIASIIHMAEELGIISDNPHLKADLETSYTRLEEAAEKINQGRSVKNPKPDKDVETDTSAREDVELKKLEETIKDHNEGIDAQIAEHQEVIDRAELNAENGRNNIARLEAEVKSLEEKLAEPKLDSETEAHLEAKLNRVKGELGVFRQYANTKTKDNLVVQRKRSEIKALEKQKRTVKGEQTKWQRKRDRYLKKQIIEESGIRDSMKAEIQRLEAEIKDSSGIVDHNNNLERKQQIRELENSIEMSKHRTETFEYNLKLGWGEEAPKVGRRSSIFSRRRKEKIRKPYSTAPRQKAPRNSTQNLLEIDKLDAKIRTHNDNIDKKIAAQDTIIQDSIDDLDSFFNERGELNHLTKRKVEEYKKLVTARDRAYIEIEKLVKQRKQQIPGDRLNAFKAREDRVDWLDAVAVRNRAENELTAIIKGEEVARAGSYEANYRAGLDKKIEGVKKRIQKQKHDMTKLTRKTPMKGEGDKGTPFSPEDKRKLEQARENIEEAKDILKSLEAEKKKDYGPDDYDVETMEKLDKQFDKDYKKKKQEASVKVIESQQELGQPKFTLEKQIENYMDQEVGTYMDEFGNEQNLNRLVDDATEEDFDLYRALDCARAKGG